MTIGVVATKTSPKATPSGGRYMVWGLSDLAGSSIAMVLTDDAYRHFWKEQVSFSSHPLAQ